jgi:hypothetical protein
MALLEVETLRHVGTDERRCVAVDGAIDNARSGEFFIAGVSRYVEYWSQPYYKLPWVTNRPTPVGVPFRFRLTATRLDSAAQPAMAATPYVYTGPFIRVRGPIDATLHPSELGWPAWLELPSRGRWLRVATMHDTWGCFVLTQ